MTKYKAQGFSNTFKNARKGLRLVLKSEINIRVHFCAALLILLLAVFLGFSVTKICVLLLTISAVICAEMVNSAIEFSLDAVFHNKYSKLVGMAKEHIRRRRNVHDVCRNRGRAFVVRAGDF